MNVKVQIEETGEVARDINIQIPRELYDTQYNKLLQSTASRARIKGFRPGRAPRDVVAKMYGDRIQNDTLEELIRGAYTEALEEHKLNVVGFPKIDIEPMEDKEDVKIKASVEVYPEPEVKDYFGVSAEVELEPDSTEQVEKELERYREMGAEVEPVTDRTVAENGDVVTVDYEGTVDGEAFDGSSASDASIVLGKGDYPEAFEKGLVGAEIGKPKEVKVKLPDDLANEKLSGKTGIYNVTLKSISSRTLPELDDDFVKANKLGETLKELKEHVAHRIEHQREHRNQHARENKVLEAVLEKNEFAVPQVMVDEEIRSILFEARLLDSQKKESYQVSMERFRDNLGSGAEFRVKRKVVIEQIIKKEGIETSDEDLSSWLDAKAAHDKVERDMIDKMYGFPGNASQLKEMVARERAVSLVVEKAKVKETQVAAADAKPSAEKKKSKPKAKPKKKAAAEK